MSDERRLRHRVVRHEWPAKRAGVACHVDDPSTTPLDHARQHGMDAVESSPQVDLDHPPPRVGVALPHGSDRSSDAGVVDEQLDRPERPGLLDRSRHLRRSGHVGDDRNGLAAAVDDRLGCLLELGSGARHDGHGRAVRCQGQCQGAPDAASAAGSRGRPGACLSRPLRMVGRAAAAAYSRFSDARGVASSRQPTTAYPLTTQLLAPRSSSLMSCAVTSGPFPAR